MKQIDWLKLFVIVFCAIVLVGEVYAYSSADGRYSSDIEVQGDEINYSLSVNGAHEYTAALLDNGSYKAVDRMYVYHDTRYASKVNEDVGVITGAVKMTQSYYLDQLVRTMEYKGLKSTYLNADELQNMMEDTLESGTCPGAGVAIMAGAIPFTVYTGDPDSLILKWIKAGGSLYWAGGYIGKYVGTTAGLDEVNQMGLFVGTDVCNTANTHSRDGELAPFRDLLCYENTHTMYAIDASTTSRPHMVTGYADGTYSTIGLFQCGNGQVVVFGGDFAPRQIRDVATTICSGLCYCSTVVDVEDGVAKGHSSGVLDASSLTGNGRVYLSVGGYFCVYAKGYDV